MLKNSVATNAAEHKTLLKVVNLTKSFGGVTAVKNVSFEVKEGGIFGLIGPNGSGKTTLFNLISGYIKPDSGRVIFDGEDITGMSPHKICQKGIARTFQIPQPFSNLTVFQSVLAAVAFRRNRPMDPQKETFQILSFCGLAEKANLPCNKITTVDKKFVEIARALATKPKLLLLDEALAGLNPSELTEALELIKRINMMGITIIMVEHIIKAIIKVCEHVIVLASGEKIAEGAPLEIISNERVIKAYLGAAYA